MARFGETHFDTFAILIDDSRPLSAMQNTLLHELLHCLSWTYNIPTPVVEGQDEEEEYVSRMDAPLLLLIKDNPEIFSWLQIEL